MKQRHLPRRNDLDETDRLIWEDLQRLFRKDLLEMEQQLAANELRASTVGAPKSHLTFLSASPKVQSELIPHSMPSTNEAQHVPSASPSATSSRNTRQQQQVAAISRKRSCFLCIALTLILSTVLSILIIPVVLWASSSMRSAFKDASGAFEGVGVSDNGYSFDDNTYQSFFRNRLDDDGHNPSSRFPRPAHQHRTYPPTSVQAAHFYAKDSAYHTLRNDKFPPVVAAAMPGRPPPLVWLPRYHIRLVSSRNDSSSTNESLSSTPSLV
ncbi:transmembrane protein, putative [Bodo saltans]|uniref:Transmembrane protein, putative n=1 Tax=Bodo saltans TaxID=75058 RepID=A0A0S4IR02_BODSA|nr:transmembrane protein, putative [Bodo saltans]|eukprot:CUF23643.1 transmembrane protein, putative [Bodo saltans]